MQLLEAEHIGRRMLAILKGILASQHPGIDLDHLAPRCGLSADWSRAADGENSMFAFLTAIRELRRGDIPDIALQVGDRAQLTDFGLLGYAVLTAPNVLQAARITGHALSTANYLLRAKLAMSEDLCLVVFTVSTAAREVREELLELSAITAWRYIQAILPDGRAARPSYLSLAYPAPAYAEHYRELMACPVHFNDAHTVLALPRQWMSIPIPTGDSQLLAACSAEVKQVLGEGYLGSSIVARVKRALVEHPQSCAFALGNTAAQLNLSPRSLRRYLAQAGTGFRRVCLEVRMELAAQYLENTNMTLKEIAYQLGYTHPNNLNRAYRDYHGAPPKALRDRRRAVGLE